MNSVSVLPADMKLNVIARVEAGCLGPDGDDHIEAFCQYANKAFAEIETHFVDWSIMPRYDRQLPEFEYQVHQKRLCQDKAGKYLHVFGMTLEQFEDELNFNLVTYIERFLARND